MEAAGAQAEERAIAEWARRFNAGDYFGAHEAAEEAWRAAAEPERSFLKGLIHASVSLHHLGRGNAHGARAKYRSAARYLAPFRPRHRGVEVELLLQEMECALAPVLSSEVSAPALAGARPRVVLRR